MRRNTDKNSKYIGVSDFDLWRSFGVRCAYFFCMCVYANVDKFLIWFYSCSVYLYLHAWYVDYECECWGEKNRAFFPLCALRDLFERKKII